MLISSQLDVAFAVKTIEQFRQIFGHTDISKLYRRSAADDNVDSICVTGLREILERCEN